MLDSLKSLQPTPLTKSINSLIFLKITWFREHGREKTTQRIHGNSHNDQDIYYILL